MSVPDPTGRCGAMTSDTKDTNGSGEPAGLVDKAKEVAGTVAEKAGPAMEKAKEVAGTVVEKAGPAMEKAKEVAGTVVEKAGPAMEKAKGSATELVDKAKDFLGSKDEDAK
jgi:hypothetical protein